MHKEIRVEVGRMLGYGVRDGGSFAVSNATSGGYYLWVRRIKPEHLKEFPATNPKLVGGKGILGRRIPRDVLLEITRSTASAKEAAVKVVDWVKGRPLGNMNPLSVASQTSADVAVLKQLVLKLARGEKIEQPTLLAAMGMDASAVAEAQAEVDAEDAAEAELAAAAAAVAEAEMAAVVNEGEAPVPGAPEPVDVDPTPPEYDDIQDEVELDIDESPPRPPKVKSKKGK